MQSLKNRVVRVSDETWDAAKAVAEKEGTTVSAVVRSLLHAWVKSSAVVGITVIAVLTLAACGSDEAPSTVAGERTPVVAASAPQTPGPAVSEALSVEERVAAGECYSTKVGPNAGVLAHMWQSLPTTSRPAAERIAALETMLAAIPADSEGCEAGDVATFTTFRESAQINLDDLRAED